MVVGPAWIWTPVRAAELVESGAPAAAPPRLVRAAFFAPPEPAAAGLRRDAVLGFRAVVFLRGVLGVESAALPLSAIALSFG
jgi:hypothetical protein